MAHEEIVDKVFEGSAGSMDLKGLGYLVRLLLNNGLDIVTIIVLETAVGH